MADWRSQLGSFLDEAGRPKPEEDRGDLPGFLSSVVEPAFEELRAELVAHGRDVNIHRVETSIVMKVSFKGDEELSYRVQGRTFPNKILPYAEVRCRERKGLKLIRVESMFRSGDSSYSMDEVTTTEVIDNFLDHYMRNVSAE